MRVQAALGIVGVITASAAVSAVAWGQRSTWGSGAAAPDAGQSNGADGGPAVDADLDAGSGAAVDAAASNDASHTKAPASMNEGDAGDTAPPPEDAGSGGYSPSDVGFSVGLNGGYSVPFGSAAGGPLNSVVLGMVPVGVNVGWFFTPRLYLGVYFVYGFGVGANINNDQCNADNVGCSAKMLRIGAEVNWHFQPAAFWDPWIGGGLGYEALLNEETNQETAASDLSSGTYGINLSLAAGIDFKPLEYLGIGPWAEVAAGPYITDSQGDALFVLHGWATFGARFHTNL